MELVSQDHLPALMDLFVRIRFFQQVLAQNTVQLHVLVSKF